MVRSKRFLWFISLFVFSLPIVSSDMDIFTAAEEGNLETVRQLVEGNPEIVSTVDDGGYSPLHKAVYSNQMNVAEYLLSIGADINALSASGSTPLHGAASYGHLEMVRFLIEKGAAIDIANAGGYTPLLGAMAGNHGEIARLLTEAGANVNARPNNGRTPLYQSIWNADIELTRFFLEKGADANIQTDMGVSLPFFAVAFRAPEFSALLADRISDLTETDDFGLNMLHYAAARGFAEQVNTLVEQGADIEAADSAGHTPLFYASLWNHESVVDLLTSRGAVISEPGTAWFQGDYLGRQVPTKTPQLFAGDELRTPFAPHGAIAIAPDGDEMFWCHQAMPVQAMWHTWQVNGEWQQPVIAPFTDPALDYADGSPRFSADGSRLFYHTRRPEAAEERKEDSDIWFVEKSGDGWGQPQPVGRPVNTDKGEYGPMVAPSGNLYFIGNDYEDSHGAGDIYVSEYIDGAYTTPKNLGPSINSPFHELSPVVASDESYIIFVSNRPYLRRRDLALYVAFKTADGWSRPVPLGRNINQGHTWHPFITADDRFVFFQRGTDYYWFSTAVIEDLRRAVIGRDEIAADLLKPSFTLGEQVFEHAATNDIALGDLDNDGDLDAVFSNMQDNDSRIYLNEGNGQFTPTEQLLTQQGHGVDLGDLDSDGDLDIVISCAEYNFDLMVYLNDGEANFTHSPQNLQDTLLAANNVDLHDIDSDGDLDAMVVYFQHDNLVYLNDGSGRFTRSDITYPNGGKWSDLDGDGDVDLFLREAGVGLETLLNDGTGHFIEHWTLADTNLNRGGVGFGDIDEDGDTDVILGFLVQSEHRHSTVLLNDGTGRFSESGMTLPLGRYARMSIGDLNGDEHPDVFLNNLGLPSAVWLNDGEGRLFDSGIRLPGEWMNTTCPMGDLDGDGDLDVFISAYAGGPNEIWFND